MKVYVLSEVYSSCCDEGSDIEGIYSTLDIAKSKVMVHEWKQTSAGEWEGAEELRIPRIGRPGIRVRKTDYKITEMDVE